ncbi:hypothetical protein V5O48_012933 [Marasmius crinis-equi]|uniref:Protein kinase domain-containing protein n=1 Tax=Marasmius crinis-equi TaxID=585013 RepID=A0ABR3F1E8_9AGAR
MSFSRFFRSKTPDGLDDMRLVVQEILKDKAQYKKLQEARGDDAQRCLDTLQVLADSPDTEDKLRSSILKLMLRLSKSSGLCPNCLAIKNVKKLGEHPVGGGGFGDVWRGKIGDQVVCLKVVKVYLVSDVKKLMTEYMREAIVWQQLRHPNLLPFMGMYYLDKAREQLCLVSPWMERGNLVQYLKNTPKDFVDHESLAYDVAAGLAHLHGMKIVHGDLKGVNILMTPEERATIADFGLSRVSDTQTLRLSSSTTTQAKGTTRWLSPELLKSDPPCSASTSSDIYAYACVVYELIEANLLQQIFTGNIPFYELSEGAVIVAVLLNNKQPSRPSIPELKDAMWGIMTSCWAHESSLRPTAKDVVKRVGGFESARTGATVEHYPAPDWNHVQLASVWKNVKYPAVDTTEFLRVLGLDHLPMRIPVPPVNVQNAHAPYPPFEPLDNANYDGSFVHEERSGSGEGFWKRFLGQRRSSDSVTNESASSSRETMHFHPTPPPQGASFSGAPQPIVIHHHMQGAPFDLPPGIVRRRTDEDGIPPFYVHPAGPSNGAGLQQIPIPPTPPISPPGFAYPAGNEPGSPSFMVPMEPRSKKSKRFSFRKSKRSPSPPSTYVPNPSFYPANPGWPVPPQESSILGDFPPGFFAPPPQTPPRIPVGVPGLYHQAPQPQRRVTIGTPPLYQPQQPYIGAYPWAQQPQQS